MADGMIRLIGKPLEAGALMPQTSTGSYYVRDAIRAICDDGEMLELRGRWAPNVVTAFAAIGGLPIGMIANNRWLSPARGSTSRQRRRLLGSWLSASRSICRS